MKLLICMTFKTDNLGYTSKHLKCKNQASYFKVSQHKCTLLNQNQIHIQVSMMFEEGTTPNSAFGELDI